MENASKDVLFTIAMDLELPSLLRWCQSGSRIQKDVCNNSDVWRSKLLRDYPDYEKFNLNRSLKETYVFMYQLSLIKKLLNTEESLYEIFLKPKIDLSGKILKKIPAFDLPNLKLLFLSRNNLTEIPTFNLPNLQELWVSNNQLTKTPRFNFPKLEMVDLSHNELTEVPVFDSPNLRHIFLGDNELTEMPISTLPNLQKLELYNNNLTEENKRKLKQKYGIKVVL